MIISESNHYSYWPVTHRNNDYSKTCAQALQKMLRLYKNSFHLERKIYQRRGSPQGDSREIKELLGSISSLNSEQTRRDISNALTILSLGASNMNTKHKEAVSRMLDQVLQKFAR